MKRRLPTLASGILVLLASACGSVVAVDESPRGAVSTSSGTGGAGGASGADGGASVCPPGKDPTCNAYPGMTTLAGVCNADGTCTCSPGFNPTPDGTCANIDLCVYGFIGSCNGNDNAPVDMGVCNPDGTCTCNPGFVLDETDRCVSAVCHGGCPVEGEQRCSGNFLQTCAGPANNCAHTWLTTDHCAPTWLCNSDATRCVKPSGACNIDTDCACGCTCDNGACLCSGSVPPSCQVDTDCGPVCAGLACVAGACQKASAHP